MKAYIPAGAEQGRAPILVEPTRQFLRPGRPKKVRENNSSELIQELLNERRNSQTNEQGNSEEKDSSLDRSDRPQDNIDISMEHRHRDNSEETTAPDNIDDRGLPESPELRASHNAGVPANDNLGIEVTVDSPGSEAVIGSRARRTRRRPTHLQDYELDLDLNHSFSCARVSNTQIAALDTTNYFNSDIIMAQEQILQQAEAPIDLLEEGEVVDAVLDEPKHSLSGFSVDVMEVDKKKEKNL